MNASRNAEHLMTVEDFLAFADARPNDENWPAEPQVLHTPGDALTLGSFDVSVALSAIYADVSLSTP